MVEVGGWMLVKEVMWEELMEEEVEVEVVEEEVTERVMVEEVEEERMCTLTSRPPWSFPPAPNIQPSWDR